MSYERDRDWAYQYVPDATAILARATIKLLSVELSSDHLDRKQATDLVVTTDIGQVAWRARREGCEYRDLTLRYRRRHTPADAWRRGFEVDKIMGGFARHYLYSWAVS